jgi:hypothetical protein
VLNLIVIIYFVCVAVSVVSTVRSESAIFLEFKAPRSLALAVMLLPFSPLILLFAAPLSLSGWAAAILSSGCCIPSVVLASRAKQAFETAGTSRVERAQSATSMVSLAGMLGLIYVAVISAFALVIHSLISESVV